MNVKLFLQVVLFALHCKGFLANAMWQRSVLVGTDVALRCLFNSKVVEWSDLIVEWNMVDKHAKKSILYTFEDGRALNSDGSIVDRLGLLQSNASLHLHNISLAHEGLYTCRIITPVVHIETTSLEVLAEPWVSLPENAAVTEGEERTLHCDIVGFYPEKLVVAWLIQNGSSTVPAGLSQFSRVCTNMAVHNQNGTYSTRSSITLHSSAVQERGIRVTCQVEHQSFRQLYNTSVMLTVHAPSQLEYNPVTLVALTSLISLLLVISLIGGALLIYRYICKAQPSVSQISQDSIIYAQVPTELKCTIQGAKDREIRVRWLKLHSSAESAAQADSESLLVSEDLSKQASLVSDAEEHHTSILPLCLDLSEDLSKYRCVIMCRGESISREIILRVKVQPSFLRISSIPQIPKLERLLLLCCRVENFYPKDVYLEWSRNDGEQVRAVTHFGPFSGSNSLYSVWSKIQLVMAREDERAVYTCRVYHSSFSDPGYKDAQYHINTQGTPPNVRFVACEPLKPSEECTLHLSIQDFCPEHVSVTWTKDGQPLDCSVFNTPPSLNINGLYSMFSFVKFTPSAEDQGSVFRCRVVHSAQKDPEERFFILTNLHLTNGHV